MTNIAFRKIENFMIFKIFHLQAQLTELQTDNERLTEEKGVLLESLCRQTEKLEDSRSKVDTLQGLLLREEQPQDSAKGYNTEREQKLVDLLKVRSHLFFLCEE